MPQQSALSNEHLLNLLVSHLSEFVIVLADPDGNFTSWHPGIERQFGYTASEFIGQNAEILFTPEDRAKGVAKQDIDQATQAGRASDTRWLVDKNGRQVFVEGITLALRGQSGLLLGFGKVLRDGTEQKNAYENQRALAAAVEIAHEEQKRMALELERSNQELEEFARIASHDLSAPLTSARWLADLLSTRHAKQLDPDGQKALKQISMGLERMTDLVEGILSHARVGMSAIGSSEGTDAGIALATAMENLRGDIETSKAAIITDPLPNLRIERRALTQLFQNLLSNAIKYVRPDTPPILRVTAARQDSTWIIAIEDNGIGIQPEWLERVFQPLQRLHGTEIKGSGIGLATCKKIVTRAGGQIWAESSYGSGSTFFFTLPGPETG